MKTTWELTKDSIKIQLALGRAIFISGQGGVGKTECIREACREAGFNVVEINGACFSPVEYQHTNLPVEKDGEMVGVRSLNVIYKRIIETCESGPTALFIDEAGQLHPTSAQPFFMSVILARLWDGEKLPDKKRLSFILAGNGAKDNAASYPLLSTLESRMGAIVPFEMDEESVLKYFRLVGMPEDLVAFLSQHREHLLEPPRKGGGDIPKCPRTWEAFGETYAAILAVGFPEDEIEWHLNCAMNRSAVAAFLSYRKLVQEVNLAEIWNDPEAANVPPVEKPDIRTAVAYWLTEKVTRILLDLVAEGKPPKMGPVENARKYLNRLGAVPESIFFSTLFFSVPKLREYAEFQQLAQGMPEIFGVNVPVGFRLPNIPGRK